MNSNSLCNWLSVERLIRYRVALRLILFRHVSTFLDRFSDAGTLDFERQRSREETHLSRYLSYLCMSRSVLLDIDHPTKMFARVDRDMQWGRIWLPEFCTALRLAMPALQNHNMHHQM